MCISKLATHKLSREQIKDVALREGEGGEGAFDSQAYFVILVEKGFIFRA